MQVRHYAIPLSECTISSNIRANALNSRILNAMRSTGWVVITLHRIIPSVFRKGDIASFSSILAYSRLSAGYYSYYAGKVEVMESEYMEIFNEFSVLGGFFANALGTKPGCYCFNSLARISLVSIVKNAFVPTKKICQVQV